MDQRTPGSNGPKPVLCQLVITHFVDGAISLHVEPDATSIIEVYGLLEVARETVLKNRILPPREQPRLVVAKTVPPGLS